MFSEWIKRTILRDLGEIVTQSLLSLKKSALDYLLVYNVKSLPLYLCTGHLWWNVRVYEP